MKKYQILLASLLTATAAFAQTDPIGEAPNRILVTNANGNYKGFVIDHLDAINFARVDGEVLAKVEVNEVATDSLRLTVKRTPDCKYYKLAVISQTIANQMPNDLSAISYINSMPSSMVPVLSEDFDNGLLSGVTLHADSDYAIMTVGFDNYGVEAGVFRCDFSTPAPVIVGNPQVEAEVVDTRLDSFTISFTPNDDVQSYWCVAGEKGVMQSQYEMFGPMFGFANFNQMIQQWGVERKGPTDNTWKDMAPNTEFEVFIAMTDANGNFAPYKVVEVSTLSLGGPGEAYVEIDLSSYELQDWDDEMLPTQCIQFDPNDQSSCYRFGVYDAATYDENPEEYKAYLCSDPSMPTVNWFFYDPIEAEYQINPSTECVAIAAAKNVNGEWGKVNEFRFTTPDECEGYESASAPACKGVVPRISPKKAEFIQNGVIPKLPTPKMVELK